MRKAWLQARSHGTKELETLKERAEYFGLDKTEDFEDFKKKYLKAADESDADMISAASKERLKTSMTI